ncbi:MAG: DUF1501 domain-containing protein [Acidobacteria bacterium]|nr:DUF1501 domain-containing protein [Acidobacteriota bacterium]
MSKTTRREFIKKSGFTLLTVGLSQQAFARHLKMAANSALTRAAALSTNDNMLVVIQLAGGNDGLNTVIPRGGTLRSQYEQFRQATLEIPVANILPIDNDAANNQLGLHPSLQKIKGLYDQKKVGVIQAVGYPTPNYSHFRSMDIWHSAYTQGLKATGWLGDYLDVSFPSNDNPLIAVSIGGSLPLSLRAKSITVPAIGNVDTYKFQADPRYADPNRPETRPEYNNRIQTFLALNREGAPERVLYEQIRLTALDAYDSSEELQSGISQYVADPSIVYPNNNPLARALQQVARIVAGDLGTKILYVSMGGFDTHQTQATPNTPLTGTHATLLGYVSDAVDAFYRDMVRMGKDDKVLMMTWSEFSRKVRENGNFGTDHGASGPQFVFGTPVKGGVFGVHPGLTDLYPGQDATKHSIDFRSIYATILEKWLAVDSHEIVGGSFETLPFV